MSHSSFPPSVSQPTHTVTVRPHRIPMRDGVRLFGLAWHPDGGGPHPVVINYDPYRSSDMRTLARGNLFEYLARHGYVVLHLSVRGTDGSEGAVADEYLLQEQLDGYDAVEWAAAQPWCNGSAGMIGTSYAGFTAVQVAMHRPPHLKAIIPVYATDDRYTDDVHYTGGALQGLCDLFTWATEMICLNALPPHESLGPELAAVWQAHLDGDEPYHFNWLAHQTDGPYWRPASLRSDYQSVQCATYVVGGWHDNYRNSAVRMFQHLACPKKAIIGPWEHVFPDWGTPGPAVDFMSQAVRFFDHWLKGIDTGIMDEPALLVYMQQYDPPHRARTHTSGYWRAEREWPSAGERALHLGPAGRLQAAPPAESGSGRFAYRPSTGVANRSWSAGGCPEDQRPDEAASLVFTSDPLESRVEILGWPKVRLEIASSAPVANLVCKLSDVAPDGASALVTWGILNLTHRNSHAQPEPLVPGVPYEVEVALDAVAWLFEPGHRLRLALSGADLLNIWPSPYPAENTVAWGGAAGSRLSLPVAPPSRPEGVAWVWRPEDAPDLGRPVIPLDRYVLRAAPGGPRISHDPIDDVVRFEVSGRQNGEWQSARLVYDYASQGALQVSERDPAHASLATEHLMTITRHGTPTQAHVHGRFFSTAGAFHLAFDLRVTAGAVEIARRQWQRSFPRNLV